jgi:HPt (histidine-containing phosphotransfer) domain-containing protein
MIESQHRPGAPVRGALLNSVIPDALIPARARFCGMILQRIMTFESFRIEINTGDNPQKALTGIIELSHKIAGVAETLGFPDIGRLASAVEQMSSNGLERKVPVEELWHRVEPELVALMDQMESHLDA